MPVPGLNRAVVQAINVGRSIDATSRPCLISDAPEEALRDPRAVGAPGAGRAAGGGRIAVSRAGRAAVAYLDVLDRAWPADKPDPITFVVIPEYVARSWWERILYNQSAKRLRRRCSAGRTRSS